MRRSNPVTRREALGLLAEGGGAAILLPSLQIRPEKAVARDTSQGGPVSVPLAYRGGYEVKPLPFDPSKLKGLSEKLLVSHHQNNYGGAVKRLNQIVQQIAALPKDAAPFQMGSLKREQLLAMNSMILHELYFANLGGDGTPGGAIGERMKQSFGSLEAWEQDFRLTGLSLGGGSGWVILAHSPRDGALHNAWAWDHTNALATGTPLVVMDMYEHAYAMDYGANARGYLDAFFQNVQWDEANRRVEEIRAKK